jgi:hypothetical protein
VFEDEGDSPLHPVGVVVVSELRRVNAEARVDDRGGNRAARAETLRVEVLMVTERERRAVGEAHLEPVAVAERGDHQLGLLDERAVRRPRLQPGPLESRPHPVGGQRVLRRADEASLETIPARKKRSARRSATRMESLKGAAPWAASDVATSSAPGIMKRDRMGAADCSTA